MNRNNGIVVTGGRVQAGALAAGRNAQASGAIGKASEEELRTDLDKTGEETAMPKPSRAISTVKLFISHAHRDVEIAEQLVTALELAMDVPDGAIRCTSVPGYKLDLGSMAPDVLRRE